MVIEVLHTRDGDRKKNYNTNTEAGRQQAAIAINKLMKSGASILLERGKKTYYVKKYDPVRDILTVAIEKQGKVKDVQASGKKSKTVAVPHVRGGLD